MTYSIAYRTGGRSNCKWVRVLDRYETRERAEIVQAELDAAGYKALIYTTVSLDAIGLPVGWDADHIFNDVDSERNESPAICKATGCGYFDPPEFGDIPDYCPKHEVANA